MAHSAAEYPHVLFAPNGKLESHMNDFFASAKELDSLILTGNAASTCASSRAPKRNSRTTLHHDGKRQRLTAPLAPTQNIPSAPCAGDFALCTPGQDGVDEDDDMSDGSADNMDFYTPTMAITPVKSPPATTSPRRVTPPAHPAAAVTPPTSRPSQQSQDTRVLPAKPSVTGGGSETSLPLRPSSPSKFAFMRLEKPNTLVRKEHLLDPPGTPPPDDPATSLVSGVSDRGGAADDQSAAADKEDEEVLLVADADCKASSSLNSDSTAAKALKTVHVAYDPRLHLSPSKKVLLPPRPLLPSAMFSCC